MIAETYWVGDYTVEVYHNPGAALSHQEQQTLLHECHTVAQNGFGEQPMDEESIRRHLLSTSTTIVIREEDTQAVGVAGSSIVRLNDDVVIYLQGAVISKHHRKRGFYRLVVALRIMEEATKLGINDSERHDIFIGTRTQNPLVYKFLHRNLKMFPYTNGYIDTRIKNIAKELSKKISENNRDYYHINGYRFDENMLVARRSLGFIDNGKEYGLNLYGDSIPFCKDDYEINRYMQENIHWHNGDALIMVGYYNRQDVEALLAAETPELLSNSVLGM